MKKEDPKEITGSKAGKRATSMADERITIDDFKKLDLRIGRVESAERVEGTDKLLKLSVDLGEAERRTIISGIATHVEPASIIGQNFVFVANLEPRAIRGVESNGMVLAASDEEGHFSLVAPQHDVPPGTKLR